MTGILLFDSVVRLDRGWWYVMVNRIYGTLTCTGMYVCGLGVSLRLIYTRCWCLFQWNFLSQLATDMDHVAR